MKSALRIIAVAVMAAAALWGANCLYRHSRLLGNKHPVPQVRVEYTITDLGTLGGDDYRIYSMNASGQVLGTFVDHEKGITHAFLYSGGKMRDIDTREGVWWESCAMNDAGDIAATIHRNGDAQQPGFSRFIVRSKGEEKILNSSNDISGVCGINNSGQVALNDDHAVMENMERHAFLYSDGSLHDLGKLDGKGSTARGINDRGEVVGNADNIKGYQHAFLYSDGKMQDLGTLGGWESYAEAINAKGVVVGGADPAGSSDDEFWYMSAGATTMRSESTRIHAFIYFDGNMWDLGPLEECTDPTREYSSRAYGINASGDVVGTFSTTGRDGHVCAFLYSHGQMVDLNTRVDLARSGFKELYSAKTINDAGQIVGEGSTPSGARLFLLTPIAAGK